MILIDVNVLVHAFRVDAPRHTEFNRWLRGRIDAREPFGLSELVLSGVLRVLTHPAVFLPPTPLERAVAFSDYLRSRPNCILVAPGTRHWEIFTSLCATAGAKGNLIPDAYLAALAIEHGCEWITTDRDFAKFEDLRWHHPLDENAL